MTERRTTEVADTLHRTTLRTFDESTWRQIENAKESGATFPAIVRLLQALYAFLQPNVDDRWYDKRVEFGRLIARADYVAVYQTGYERGVTLGLHQTLTNKSDDLERHLAFVLPSMKAIAGIYLASPGSAVKGEQLRSALSPGLAAATDIYSSPIGTLGSKRSRDDLLKDTWIQGAMSAVKVLDEVQRRGLLKTLDYEVANLISVLQALGEKWIDGLFALNGHPSDQGEYVGRMIGAATAEIIWAAAEYIAFEAVSRAFITSAEGLESFYEAARRIALEQKVALLAQQAKSLLAFLETELAKDIPDVFYRAFIVRNPKGLERLLKFAGEVKGRNLIERARQLKGKYILEELIPYTAEYPDRIAGIEQFLREMGEGTIWQPRAYKVRRIWIWQYSDFMKKYDWIELGDGGLAVFPKSGVKSPFRAGLANVFESKAAGVVEKAAASPEFLGGQVGKDVERLDFDPDLYRGNTPAVRLEVDGLAVSGEPTIIELKPGELWFSRNSPRVLETSKGPKKVFGTYWTVVAPPDTVPATMARTARKLEAAGLGSDVWRHPVTDAQAQRISEAVLRYVEKQKK